MGWPFLIVSWPSLAIIFFWSFFAFGWQYYWGLGETGMGHPVSWAFYLVNFVFFIGISHAGALVSAVLRITHARWGTPFGRAAEAVTVFALAAGPTNILFDLGRSIRFYWVAIHAQFKSPLIWDFTCIMTYFVVSDIFLYVLMVPDIALLRDRFPVGDGSIPFDSTGCIHAQFKSPLIWDFTCIMTYFVVSNIFLYVLMVPDIALLRDRMPGRRWFYKPLSLGWTGTEKQWLSLGKVIGFLCIAVIPIAVSVHTVVSWVFGMQTQPMWHSSIFAPYFVTGAIFSGIATIIIVTIALRKVYHLEQYMKPYHLNNLGLLLLVFTLLWFYFTFTEHLVAVYGGDSFELAVFWSKFTGKYAPLFWTMVTLCFVIPFPILVFRRTVPGLLIASISIVIGMWLERFLIIIPLLLSAPPPLSPRRLHAFMGGMVHDRRPLCGFHSCFRPFLQIFPCNFYLGNGKGRSRKRKK